MCACVRLRYVRLCVRMCACCQRETECLSAISQIDLSAACGVDAKQSLCGAKSSQCSMWRRCKERLPVRNIKLSVQHVASMQGKIARAEHKALGAACGANMKWSVLEQALVNSLRAGFGQ